MESCRTHWPASPEIRGRGKHWEPDTGLRGPYIHTINVTNETGMHAGLSVLVDTISTDILQHHLLQIRTVNEMQLSAACPSPPIFSIYICTLISVHLPNMKSSNVEL